MTQVCYPFDSSEVLEDAFSDMARTYSETGVIGNAGDPTLEAFADGSGLVVKVKSGRASINGYFYKNTATVTLPLSSNSSGNPRIDLVVVRVDPSSDSGVLAVKEGVPAASPSFPTLTQEDFGVYEIPIAGVRVENGAAVITADKAFERRLFRPYMLPTGASMWWAGTLDKAPAGFLPYSNTQYSRNTYYRLFDAIGETWGAGNGTTTFNIPPPGYVPVSLDPLVAQFNALGKKVGELTHLLTLAESAPHYHEGDTDNATITARVNNDDATGDTGTLDRGRDNGDATDKVISDSDHHHHYKTNTVGGGQAHNNIQPTMTGYWLIKT